MTELGERLLLAHVEHALSRVRGDTFKHAVEAQVRAAFAWFEQVELSRVITPSRVMEVVDRFVIDLRVSGGITELAGEIARVVVRADGGDTQLGDILTGRSFRDFSDKLLSLKAPRREILSVFLHSSAFSELSARLLSQRITAFLSRPLSRELSVLPRGFVQTLRESRLPALERQLSGWLFQHLEQSRGRYLHEIEERLVEAVDDAFLRSLLDDVWADVSRLSLSHLVGSLGEQDLEDAVTLVFEFWLRFRKTPYFRRVTEAAVTHFFAKYGDDSVASVIEDMGVSEAMVAQEVVASLTPWVKAALESGFLEAQLREELATFYASPLFVEACQGPSEP